MFQMIKNKNKKKPLPILLLLLPLSLLIISFPDYWPLRFPSYDVLLSAATTGARATIGCGLQNDAVFATGALHMYKKNTIMILLYYYNIVTAVSIDRARYTASKTILYVRYTSRAISILLQVGTCGQTVNE